MQGHQRKAPSRVRFGTLIVGIALSLVSFGMAPAQAATTDVARTGHAAVKAKLAYRTTVPRWVGRPDATSVRLPGTSNVSIDWKWLRGGWEIEFTKTETNNIAGGTSACAGVLGALAYPLPALGFACAAISAYAWTVRAFGKCMNMFVPVSLVNFSLGARSC
jgi:hypothetical protein